MKSDDITGVAGLLGSNIARFLLQKGFDVRGCDNLSGGYVDNIPLNDFDKIDILDTKTLIRYMGEVDLVINDNNIPLKLKKHNEVYIKYYNNTILKERN